MGRQVTRYLSVASGIEAASVAWSALGWDAVAYSEIEPFPCAVLADRWPQTPNLGDMTKYKEWNIDRPIDLLVGGTSCQSFSVAGLRRGLDDPRGNLMLVYLAIARRFRPAWIVWENVPGVLSVDGGRAFGSFLGGLAELGFGWAYRVCDAEYFGVPQRRRRVFVVGYLGDWRPAAAVLFERESVRGNPPPRRETGARVAPTVSCGPPYSRTGNERVETEALVVEALTSHAGGPDDNKSCVRRLTPTEVESLQGLPRGYTAVTYRGKPAADGPRYKALGNSMAVPVMEWIGRRIERVVRVRAEDGR